MDTFGFIPLLLTGLCINYFDHKDDDTFNCMLQSDDEKIKRNALHGKKLKIAVYNDPPLSYIEEDSSGVLRGKGVAFEVITTLQRKYGFSYDIMQFDSKEVGSDQSGILKLVADGEVDMVAGFLPVLPGSNEYVNWGTDMGQNKYDILMKRPSESATGNGLLAPFTTEVWLLILVSLGAVGPILYAVMWIRSRACNDSTIQVYPLPSCMWFVYGGLMKQGSTLNPETDSSRIVFATWWIFILILTAFYTANLTAFLTLSIFTLPINSIEDVAKPPTKWFSVTGGAIQYALKKQEGDLDVLLKSIEKGYGKFIDTDKVESFRLINDGWLYLDAWTTLTRLVFEDYLTKTDNGVEESKRCTYVVANQQAYLIRTLAFAYPNSSNLPQFFNPIVQRFVESGILKHLTSEGLPASPICPLNLGNKERRLRNSDLFTTYACVVGGFTCAFAVFCGEIIFRFCLCRPKKVPTKVISEGKPNILKSNSKSSNKIVSFTEQIKKNINGRDYIMIRVKNGKEQLIPLRAPSALLFQYI